MKQVRSTIGAIAVVLTSAALLTGCATTERSAPADTAAAGAHSVVAVPASINRAAGGGAAGGGGGAAGGGAAKPVTGLPAGWPVDVPVPAGKLLGSTHSTGRWTVLLLEPGSAATVLKSAGAFYKAAGFTAVSASVLNKGTRHITMVVENRDHSATKTNLVIQLTTP